MRCFPRSATPPASRRPDLRGCGDGVAHLDEAGQAVIETGAMEVDARTTMIAVNREDPAALDRRFRGLKPALEAMVRDHAAL